MMNKRQQPTWMRPSNIGGILCLAVMIYVMYDILLHGAIFPLSISAVQGSMNHWSHHWHILAVGLLPVYVACVFFGAAICGLCFGTIVQRWFIHFFKFNNLK